ncbi:primosomal protein N' [Cupriavidus respiraculi]|uniref:Replication restart protein PriA n=1 Tax=Cupriavidus respiraculi TaxID=195930 RepID=A0ABM8XSP8_9BURK|nr:primosomal protein N' [Cupriavidus respiraculi]CAG9183350.1 Primosomal protein N' [Cupriavidus respiraculi]
MSTVPTSTVPVADAVDAAAIVQVALDTPADDRFDYAVGAADRGSDVPIQPGDLLAVPFGRRTVAGVAVGRSEHTEVPADRLRAVSGRLSWMPPLGPHWLALARFASAYYHRRLGEVMLPALPPGLRDPQGWERLAARVQTARYRVRPGQDGPLLQAVPARARSVMALATALANGPDAGTGLTMAQARALCGAAPARLAEWRDAGWLEVERVDRPLLAVDADAVATVAPPLNPEQRDAVEAIAQAQGFAPFLLHGVTGSGKTEVYLHAIAATLARDPSAQVLMLVPEINLTPQLQARVAARFPHLPLAVLHSGMADQERTLHWLAAHRGEARIVLGTRLAVMASVPHLALLIVDEEHDTSYKQQEGLRYSARDLAVWRAKQLGTPVVLGSATPSMESWWRAEQGAYRKLVLRERAQADAALPAVRLIDLNHERQRQQPLYEGLSKPLLAAIEARIARGEQSLLFLNRRGYAPVIACDSCGWLSGCPRCSAYLVLHRPERCLRCHHCGLEAPVPRQCPDCGNIDIAPLGRGTQRIEEALAARFPEARIARLDADSTRRKGSAQAMLDEVHAGEVDILVGTQMVAKGHDFQRVTLVGIVHPDAAMFSHDFRAAEHLFASLMQVAGRAGRAGLAGEVLIQTRYPDAPALQALARHDYDGFAAAQLRERRQAGLPPFAYQVLLTAEHGELARAVAFLQAARERADQAGLAAEVQLHDPVPMSMVRINHRERAQMLVECGSRATLQRFVSEWAQTFPEVGSAVRGVRWQLEIDPLRI